MATAKKTAPAKTPAKKTAAKKTAAKTTETEQSKAASGQAKKHEPTHQEIAALAHKYSQERGHHHHGSHVEDWLRAERELRGH